MLKAENLGLQDVRTQVGSAGTVATTSAGDLAMDPDSGCIAAVIGRPRWPDPQARCEAATKGNAVAALALYRARGANLLQEAGGNFAIAIIDPTARRVLMAVDRTGTERLCFATVGSTLVFSTSARAVARHPAVQAPVSRQALFEYLYCHMVPSPDTAFSNVEKLLPAECLEVTDTKLSRRFYWQLAHGNPTATDDATQRQEFLELARQAVARECDQRPTGAFLSGGTDSSTVSGLLGQVTGKPPETFSIGFDAQGFDELEYARITARHFGTHPHEYYVTPDDVAEAMPMIAAAYDEPFGNASAAPTYFCAKLARENGVEVILAGDGGDEFFGGNERYAKQGVFEHYHRLPTALRRLFEPAVLNIPFANALMPLRKAQSYIRQARIPLPDRLETYNFLHRDPLTEIFEPEFLAAVDTDRPLALMRDAYFRCASPEPIERMMHLDHKFTLADNDLRKVSRMCEAAGVEVRFPFLDDDLVAFSGRLRPDQKVHKGRLRVLFKDALRGFLPDETITKSKHGFGLPFGLWLAMEGPLRDQADAALKSLAHRGIVQPDYLTRLWKAHRSEHASYYGVMIWVLVQLELWLHKQAAT
ncbi:MAG: asparagine synthase C-terminal domain-containing protein [Rhodocyclaceae bacterium]|jgi:asparagine synthase (glutamine-hydrolysing)|nr:asparagine synthase C-terminal domain-containing protein [Rhodocyclaceae bacterium]